MLEARRTALVTTPPSTRGADAGAIVLGWLTKLTVVLAIAGVALFDAISVGTTTASVADQGVLAAQAASETWDETKSAQEAYDTAVASALEQNPENVVSTKGFQIDADGTVHLVISREAKTLVLYRWGRTAKWAHVSQTAKGRSVAV